MATQNSFTWENTVIEHSQARIGQYTRETPMLEGTRQQSLANAFRGWNTDWFGRDEGQKRELAGARACLIVKNRTLGSWTFTVMAREMVYRCHVRGRHLQYARHRARGRKFICPRSDVGVVWHKAKQKGAEGVNDFYMRMLS